MSFQILVTDRAAVDLRTIAAWWSANRSPDQAERWYQRFVEAIASLKEHSQRCGLAREDSQFAFELRQLTFALAGRPTHRAVFTIQGEAVVVLTIRHLAQAEQTPQDLP